MNEKPDPELQLRLRIALRENPAGDADEFAELVAAMLAFRTLGGDVEKAIARQCGLADPQIVRLWASGAVAPTPKFRAIVVKYLRGRAKELGVEEA